jgi:ATP-dependent protease Clp ATPase subunit
MLPLQFDVPSMKDLQSCSVTEKMINDPLAKPIYTFKTEKKKKKEA